MNRSREVPTKRVIVTERSIFISSGTVQSILFTQLREKSRVALKKLLDTVIKQMAKLQSFHCQSHAMHSEREREREREMKEIYKLLYY
jgi:hypothetical protein